MEAFAWNRLGSQPQSGESGPGLFLGTVEGVVVPLRTWGLALRGWSDGIRATDLGLAVWVFHDWLLVARVKG